MPTYIWQVIRPIDDNIEKEEEKEKYKQYEAGFYETLNQKLNISFIELIMIPYYH